MEKREFILPEVEVVRFEESDILTDSNVIELPEVEISSF